MVSYFSEFGIGFKILLFGSPLYFISIIDILNNALAQLRSLDFEPILPSWTQLPIAFAFFIGFVLFFTSPDEQEIQV